MADFNSLHPLLESEEDIPREVISGLEFVLLKLYHTDKLNKIIVAPDVKFRWILDKQQNISFYRVDVGGGESFS